MKQQEVLKKVIPELRADTSVTAVMLMGSVAQGTQYPTSDLDLFILGHRNRFQTEIIDDIMVEYLYITPETAQSRLDKTGMEVYHYLGSKIVYDLNGRLLRLIQTAMNKYKNYRVSEKEKEEIRHWFYSAKVKINAAIDSQEFLKVDFITATTSWKAVEAVFAVNDIPLPPASRVLQELPNLKQVPEDDWFAGLFSKDTDKRIETLLTVIDWTLQIL